MYNLFTYTCGNRVETGVGSVLVDCVQNMYYVYNSTPRQPASVYIVQLYTFFIHVVHTVIPYLVYVFTPVIYTLTHISTAPITTNPGGIK